MAALLTFLLLILALPAIIVLFVGLFITGIGAVMWILVKIGWALAVAVFVCFIVWIFREILE